MTTNSNILVPFDGSDSAQAALRIAIDIAVKFDEAVLLIHVQPSFRTPHSKIFFSEEDIRSYQQSLYEEAIASGVQILKETGIKYETKLLIGIPKEEICKEAHNRRVRYIVIGSRGYSPFVGSVLGSVSQGVLNIANCPVMVVPPPDK
ncbi:Nucleotide-binding universal stress protein, UspA family [Fontibacillus panacisegetis]|uniref:Nucleotide-binding universal stress protein, UspA family n=1 Tax=Fontibacillus panacisegetis TaxID=670482 RepID=A0A1G7JAM3_9BACL|nr:universal stress protein [Fontibacillus panacisegetis]SDF21926.1 Nucleotide-binding universal stress protein, UspA family [Fontibacillus panacisegetis]